MDDEIVKLHSAPSTFDAAAVMNVLNDADIKYAVVVRIEEGYQHVNNIDMPEGPIDLYVHRDDLIKAEQVLTSVLDI